MEQDQTNVPDISTLQYARIIISYQESLEIFYNVDVNHVNYKNNSNLYVCICIGPLLATISK